MLNFLTRISIIFTIFYSGAVLAMTYPLEEDIEKSKRSFLISNIPYEKRYSNNDKKLYGVMTLCFRPVPNKPYEHPALVFEFFLKEPGISPLNREIDLAIIDHSQGDDCYGLGCVKGLSPHVGDKDHTLTRVYRQAKYDSQGVTLMKYDFPSYYRYASWVLPNEDLKKGYDLASNDEESYRKIFQDAEKQDPRNPKYDSTYEPIATGADKKLYKELSARFYTCNHYTQRIMREVGLTEVDFGWWPVTASNLKSLVDDYIKPAPTSKKYSQITLPGLPAKKEK